MKLVIAEKPSVAQSIGKVIGATQRKDGYIEGNGYIVSWCVGHLVGLANPESYGEQYKSWANLPVIPTQWIYETIEKTKAQYNILKTLMKDDRVTSLVCATDAGREGELIFRHVYTHAKCSKPFERLWISSLEDTAIANGFANLEPGNHYDNLYQSALCREQADWAVGMNATRFFTNLYKSSRALSIGRVQTPTLAMIVRRDNDINNFVKTKYYTVTIQDADNFFTATSEKLQDLSEAENIQKICHKAPATVSKVVKEEKKTSPPKLYDLTSLQRDANRLYGFTASQTLESIQRLYDNKLASYPRTDSQYLTEDMEETARQIISIIIGKMDFTNGLEYRPDINIVMNNKKVSDHHAIIPTANLQTVDFNSLSDTDNKVLLLIAGRLLVATSGKYIYKSTNIKFDCAGHTFTAKGKTVIDKGFKTIEERLKQNSDTETEKELPEISEGEVFEVTSNKLEHYTTPPKPYTEDTLLSAMERAGNDEYDTDEVERKGLGTPATRASIIETIINRGYVERNKKQLLSTEKGKQLIGLVPDKMKSAKMTADWENKLLLIAKGEGDSGEFMTGIVDFIKDFVSNTVADASIKNLFNDKEVIGKCPRCGNDVYEGKANFYCSNTANCKFALWKQTKFFENKGKTITKAVAKSLLKTGKVHFKDLYSEAKKKTYEADILLDDTGEYANFKLEFGGGNK